MAAVDLYGNDAGQIRSAYNTHLRRDASDDEVSGWLSGSYGGGGLSDWLNQISNSGEAQQYKPPAQTPVIGTTPNVSRPQNTSPQGNLDYWSQQGVPSSQMFNFSTGQLQPGWQRTDQGYQRTESAPQGGDLQSWLMTMLRGNASPDALAGLESQLNQRGITLQKDSAGAVRGRLYLPGGKAVDVVNPNGWGQPWTWIDRGVGGPSDGGGHGGGLPQFSMPGNQYSDPYTKLLEEMMRGRIGQLQSGQDPGYQQLISYLQKRFEELQTPGRTGAENEVIRTQALDPIERDRQAARQRMLERLSARGVTLESGIAQQALLEIDKAFDAERATSQNIMAVDELNRREGRSQYAEGLAGQLYNIPQARNREALGYAGALSDLGPQRLQLAMQAAGAGGNPSSMFQNLMQLAGLNQNAAMYGAQNQQSLWSGLGSIAAMLANAGR